MMGPSGNPQPIMMQPQQPCWANLKTSSPALRLPASGGSYEFFCFSVTKWQVNLTTLIMTVASLPTRETNKTSANRGTSSPSTPHLHNWGLCPLLNPSTPLGFAWMGIFVVRFTCQTVTPADNAQPATEGGEPPAGLEYLRFAPCCCCCCICTLLLLCTRV